MYKSIIVILLLLFAAWLIAPEMSDDPNQRKRATDLPWQITYDRTSSQVFGITLGQSTLAEAATALKTEYELAWFDNPNDSFDIEAYFARVTLSGLEAKVVLEIDKGNFDKEFLKKNSGKPEVSQSKAIKYPIADLKTTFSTQKVLSIAYVPKVSLDEDLLKARFGEPEKVIKITAERDHWLYSEKGLDIVVNRDGKEVIQYIAPSHFERLLKKVKDEQMLALKEQEQSSSQ